MPKPPAAIKLRLRRLSCNGPDVLPCGTQVLFTGLSRPPILSSSSTWGRAVQLASHDSNLSLGRFVFVPSAHLNACPLWGRLLLTGFASFALSRAMKF